MERTNLYENNHDRNQKQNKPIPFPAVIFHPQRERKREREKKKLEAFNFVSLNITQRCYDKEKDHKMLTNMFDAL